MKYIIIIILLTFSTPVKAGFHVGSSVAIDNLSSNYNVGYSKSVYSELLNDKLYLDLATNVLFPTEDNLRKKGFKIKYKATYVSFLLGKKVSSRFVLSFMVAGVKVDNSVYLGNTNISREKIRIVVLGSHLNYSITDKIAASIAIVAPNTKIDQKTNLIVGVNFYF